MPGRFHSSKLKYTVFFSHVVVWNNRALNSLVLVLRFKQQNLSPDEGSL